MPRLNVANKAKSELAESIDSLVDSFDVEDTSLFPDTPFMATIVDDEKDTNREIVKVLDVTGDTLEVERGQEDTTAIAHPKGALIGNRFTAGTFKNIQGEIDAHTADYVSPHKYEDEGEDSYWTGVIYRLVMINGEPFMEVIENE